AHRAVHDQIRFRFPTICFKRREYFSFECIKQTG
ncbi:hypothetical protein D043_1872B, partial [Vibrio parahaemolyticus EKP-021]